MHMLKQNGVTQIEIIFEQFDVQASINGGTKLQLEIRRTRQSGKFVPKELCLVSQMRVQIKKQIKEFELDLFAVLNTDGMPFVLDAQLTTSTGQNGLHIMLLHSCDMVERSHAAQGVTIHARRLLGMLQQCYSDQPFLYSDNDANANHIHAKWSFLHDVYVTGLGCLHNGRVLTELKDLPASFSGHEVSILQCGVHEEDSILCDHGITFKDLGSRVAKMSTKYTCVRQMFVVIPAESLPGEEGRNSILQLSTIGTEFKNAFEAKHTVEIECDFFSTCTTPPQSTHVACLSVDAEHLTFVIMRVSIKSTLAGVGPVVGVAGEAVHSAGDSTTKKAAQPDAPNPAKPENASAAADSLHADAAPAPSAATNAISPMVKGICVHCLKSVLTTQKRTFLDRKDRPKGYLHLGCANEWKTAQKAHSPDPKAQPSARVHPPGTLGDTSKKIHFLLVTKQQRGHGLRQDLNLYQCELASRDVDVSSMELKHQTVTEFNGLSGAKRKPRQKMDSDFETVLKQSTVLIGFETLGDHHSWEAIIHAKSRNGLIVMLVPNLEQSKQSNLWVKSTMDNLQHVDILVAKTECVFERLDSLRLCQKFSHSAGNLSLVPHSTQLIDIGSPIIDPSLRTKIIHFHGSSMHKNTKHNCIAAAKLIKQCPTVFTELIIKCSSDALECGAAGEENLTTTPEAGAFRVMSETELQRYIQKHGLSHTDRIGKYDLEQRALQALKRKLRAGQEVLGCKHCKIGKLKDELKSMGLDVPIRFVDWHLTESEKCALYSECRLAMCASHCEGFGHYILEAAAYGCQVVTTNGMPMKSVLGGESAQVALAAPETGKPMNLGMRYTVGYQEIFSAGMRLEQCTYRPGDCIANAKNRMSTFKQHFEQLLERASGSAAESSALCNFELPARQMCQHPGCKQCMYATLKTVNYQSPDTLEWLCDAKHERLDL